MLIDKYAPDELHASDQTSLDPTLNKHINIHQVVQLNSPVAYKCCPACGQHAFDTGAVVCPFCQAAVTWQLIDKAVAKEVSE